MNAYIRLMRLDKPIGSLLLLWPTYWALFLSADGWPDLDLLIIFTLGVVVMRSAGCVINDYADRDIDKHVKRTRNRPITSGEISIGQSVGTTDNVTFNNIDADGNVVIDGNLTVSGTTTTVNN